MGAAGVSLLLGSTIPSEAQEHPSSCSLRPGQSRGRQSASPPSARRCRRWLDPAGKEARGRRRQPSSCLGQLEQLGRGLWSAVEQLGLAELEQLAQLEQLEQLVAQLVRRVSAGNRERPHRRRPSSCWSFSRRRSAISIAGIVTCRTATRRRWSRRETLLQSILTGLRLGLGARRASRSSGMPASRWSCRSPSTAMLSALIDETQARRSCRSPIRSRPTVPSSTTLVRLFRRGAGQSRGQHRRPEALPRPQPANALGQGTFDKTIAGIRLLRSQRRPFHVISVLPTASMAVPREMFDFYVEEGIDAGLLQRRRIGRRSCLTILCRKRARCCLLPLSERVLAAVGCCPGQDPLHP